MCSRNRFRTSRAVLVLAAVVVTTAPAVVWGASGIPERIGKWRVTVGPPGNEFYQEPQETAKDDAGEAKTPSKAVLRRVDDGALDEIPPPEKSDGEKTPAEVRKERKDFRNEMKSLLGKYRKRFNFNKRIQKLGASPKNPDGSYRYVVMGDSRSQWDLWSSIVKHIDQLDPKPDFVINSGDVVPKGYSREYNEYYIPPLLETDIPYFIAIGNHDDSADSMAREYRYLFGKKALNYYFDYGRARYVFVDTVTKSQEPEKTMKWLDKTLAQTPKGYRKYVSAHKPPATIEKWAYHSLDENLSKLFTDLMTKHQVDEVYHGHIHAYSTAVFNGVSYTLSGGGGAGLHDRYGPMGNIHHYVICDVAPDGSVKQQVVRFYDSEK